MLRRFILLGTLLGLTQEVLAITLPLPESGDKVGEITYVNARAGDMLYEVGLRFGIGAIEMSRANPQVDSSLPLSENIKLRIPSQFTLPKVPRRGLVINLKDYRLYFFPKDDNVVMTYPIGIGRKGWDTPIGKTKIIAKEANPVWHPTKKVRADAARNGMLMPDELPANAHNPLGQYALRLGWPTYLIHGSYHHDGIGQRVSAGCIRMLPEDIAYLFQWVKVGTPVLIINE